MKKKVIEYILFEETTSHGLELQINAALNRGYELYRSPSISGFYTDNVKYTIYIQAMVKYEN